LFQSNTHAESIEKKVETKDAGFYQQDSSSNSQYHTPSNYFRSCNKMFIVSWVVINREEKKVEKEAVGWLLIVRCAYT
jgi:hypothetical protein